MKAVVSWLMFMLIAGLLGFTAAMLIHNAADAAEGPKWKIVVTLDGPPGKQTLTYGESATGVHWFATQEECEKTRKGGADKKYDLSWAAVQKQLVEFKKHGLEIEAKAECVTDNSI